MISNQNNTVISTQNNTVTISIQMIRLMVAMDTQMVEITSIQMVGE